MLSGEGNTQKKKNPAFKTHIIISINLKEETEIHQTQASNIATRFVYHYQIMKDNVQYAQTKNILLRIN